MMEAPCSSEKLYHNPQDHRMHCGE